MSAAYGAIAVKICQCIRERHQLIGTDVGNEGKPADEFANVGRLRRVKTDQPIHWKRY
jgi:hypothetical protein